MLLYMLYIYTYAVCIHVRMILHVYVLHCHFTQLLAMHAITLYYNVLSKINE